MPRISVLIPSYNCAAYLPAAIESVLAQTYRDFEIVVLDDGSTDDTAAVLQPYADRITYIRQQNGGVASARNAALRHSTGELVAWLDADDRWLPEKLALQEPLLADPAVGLVYCDLAVHYSDGRVLPSYLEKRPLAGEGRMAENFIRSRFLMPSSVLVRRSALEQCGLFDEEMKTSEDVELFLKICLHWPIRRVSEVLVIRYEGSHNLTADEGRMTDSNVAAFEKVLRQERTMPASTEAVLRAELAQHLWWRGYRAFGNGFGSRARADLLRSGRLDGQWRFKGVLLSAATYLPGPVLRRLQGGASQGR